MGTRGAGAEGPSPARLAPAFDRMYATVDRASGPPERLQASPLMALYSGCRERAFGKEVDHHLFFRWCPDMDLLERSFNANVFTWNR